MPRRETSEPHAWTTPQWLDPCVPDPKGFDEREQSVEHTYFPAMHHRRVPTLHRRYSTPSKAIQRLKTNNEPPGKSIQPEESWNSTLIATPVQQPSTPLLKTTSSFCTSYAPMSMAVPETRG